MVELLDGFPDHVAAYSASGKVTADEYKTRVMARIDEVARRYGKINFLVKLETGMENYSLKTFVEYLVISFKHFSKWERMAIVSDQRTLRLIYDMLSPLVHGTIETYELKDYEQAKAWVSGPLAT